MRIALPDLQGPALHKFLVENKSSLIAKKKMLPIKSDNVICDPELLITPDKGTVIKSDGQAPTIPDTGILRVDVVANVAWWCDTHMDVPTDTCYDESIDKKGILLPHIKNHAWDDCTAHVGDVVAVYKKMVSMQKLGLTKRGSASCICWTTDIMKEYDEKVYRFYRNGKINQHSIGLQYLSIELAVNNKDYEKEIDFWNKYIDKIINKDMVVEKGYFWLITKARLIENSSVLFGACEPTPTLDAEARSAQIEEPVTTTPVTDAKKSLDLVLPFS